MFAWSRTVLEAVYTGIPEAVERALNKLDEANAIRALKSAAQLGRTPIMHAASRGNLDVFNVVLREMELRLDEGEVNKRAGIRVLTRRGFVRLSFCQHRTLIVDHPTP